MPILHSDRLNRDFDCNRMHCGLVLSPLDDNKEDKTFMDKWVFLVEGESFDYYTGIGHRKIKKMLRGSWEQEKVKKLIHGGARIIDFAAAKALLEQGSEVVFPKLDDLLYSLVMDSEASRMTFAEWCHEFGYDEDSRKALATYELCQKEADKLKHIGVDLAKAREAFQDY